MKRKLSVCLFLLLILFSSFFISAASDLQDSAEGLKENLENAEDKIDASKELLEDNTWDYLAEEWKAILLKNSFISGVDSFFRKINFLFFILFGEDYDISLTLLFVIIFWIFFAFNFTIIFRDYSALSEEIAFPVAFFSTLLLVHIGLYRKMAELTFKLLFYKEGVWGWIWFVILLFLMGLVYAANKMISKQVLSSREARAKMKEDLNREILDREAKRWKKIGDVFNEVE